MSKYSPSWCRGYVSSREPVVKDSCDPYEGLDHSSGATCGSHCAASASDTYAANITSIGSVIYVPGRWGTLEETERLIQQQVLTRGAIVSCFWVYSDFYNGGVYIKNPAATKIDGHAVFTIGWGVDNGVKYWLAENSQVPTTTARARHATS